jgi:hypothetical protein
MPAPLTAENFGTFAEQLKLFARLQSELREAAKKYYQESGDTLNTMARTARIPWGSLKNFLDGDTTLGGGRGLRGLTDLLGCIELGNQIEQLGTSIGDRHKGVATNPPEVVEVVLRMLEVWLHNAEGMTQAVFSQVFLPHDELVVGILTAKSEAMRSLRQPELRAALIQQLDDPELPQFLKKAAEQDWQQRQQQAQKVLDLEKALLPHYEDKLKLAAALGFSYSSLRNAEKGEAGAETYAQMIERAQYLLHRHGDSPSVASSATPPDEFGGLAGITTEDGVRFVLTPASFQQLELVPLVELRNALKRSIEITRGLLNLAAQQKDEQARAVLQEELGKEVRDLEYALRQFTFAHPNELLPLYEDSRRIMKERSSKSSKPTSRKERG